MDGPGKLAFRAFKNGITRGREGKGAFSGDLVGPWPETLDGSDYLLAAVHRATKRRCVGGPPIMSS